MTSSEVNNHAAIIHKQHEYGANLILGERVFPIPAPLPVLIRLPYEDRKFPLFIGGSKTSNIWDEFLFSILYQDVLAMHSTSESEQGKLTGITVIVPNQELFDKAKRVICPQLSTGKLIQWNITDHYPWSINPLSGTAHEAAVVMVKLMTEFYRDTNNKYARDHVYCHTLLLKFLHEYQEEIQLIIHDHTMFETNPTVPLSYHDLFHTCSCSLDQWLMLYADPYLTKEASITLSILVKHLTNLTNLTNRFEKSHCYILSSGKSIHPDEIADMNRVLSFLNECYAYKRNFRYSYHYEPQDHGKPLFYLDRKMNEFVRYPVGHKYEGREAVFDSNSEDLTGVILLCMFLQTNTAVRKLLIGSTNIDLKEHLEEGGILLINLDEKWGNSSSRSLFETLLITKIQQAMFSRSSSSHHSLLIGDGSHYLINHIDAHDLHLQLIRSRSTGVFVTIGAPDFSIIRDSFTSIQIENVVALFRNRIVISDIHDPIHHLYLQGDPSQLEEFSHLDIEPRRASVGVYRGASPENIKPQLIKGIPFLHEKALDCRLTLLSQDEEIGYK